MLLGSCLQILGAVLIAPVLPQMQEHFRQVPGAEVLGRNRLLLVAYAIAGTAPLWLDSLPAIVASRALVGVMEAAIMTCCTRLIGDLFSGAVRSRWLAAQVMCTAIAATVFLVLSGALGAAGWRTPFWAFAVSLLLVPAMATLLWSPRPAASADGVPAGRHKLEPVPWRRLAPPVAVTLFGAVAFYLIPVEFGDVPAGFGVTSSQTIGLATAVTSLGTVAGAVAFGRIAPTRPQALLPVAFGLAALGLCTVALADSPNGAEARESGRRVSSSASSPAP